MFKFLSSTCIKENSVIQVDDKNLNISENSYYNESIGEGIYNVYSDYIIVLPDKLCENLTLASTDLAFNTKNNFSYEESTCMTEFSFIRFFTSSSSIILSQWVVNSLSFKVTFS